jgi:hypothetical protein
MCGEEYGNTHAPDIQIALVSIVTGNDALMEKWGGIIPRMIDLHYHKNNTQGVADLIGGREDE